MSARLSGILDHIASHISDPDLSLTKVARRLGMSPRYLQRIWRHRGHPFNGTRQRAAATASVHASYSAKQEPNF
jgi:AraC-like DNA-binding protein